MYGGLDGGVLGFLIWGYGVWWRWVGVGGRVDERGGNGAIDCRILVCRHMIDGRYVTVGFFTVPSVVLPQGLLRHGGAFHCLLCRGKLTCTDVSLS